MRKPPPLQEWLKFPVTSVVALLAILATLAWKGGMDISFMFMDSGVWRGQLWRLVTSALPHVDLIHIAFNLYWLWVFGTLVEGTFGSYRTLAILLLFAAGSAAAQYAVSVGGVGLSGVGYGLFGLLWVLSRKDARFADAVDNQTIGLFVAWFFLCIFLTRSQVWSVGNTAHGMGAILGVLLGFCIVSEETVRRLVAAALCLVILVDFLLASFARSYINFSSSWEEFALRGYQNLEEHDYKAALDDFQKALKLNRHDSATWYNLGLAYHELRKDEEAVDALRHAYEENPSSNEFRATYAMSKSHLAYVRQIQGNHKDAVILYKESLALNDNQAQTWFNVSLAYQKLGDLRLASDAAEKAVNLEPQNNEFRNCRDDLRKSLNDSIGNKDP